MYIYLCCRCNCNGQIVKKTPQLQTPVADSCIEDDRLANICNAITKQTAKES